ncbi:S8 family serine peptidase [Streptomyces sp. P01-B04]|uniref:S8 family serine peptidase n=1 Tax=Streptomyces poriferorum TaxID=2798799 RepID=UPI001C5DC8B5|nr:S8 family serine peptidase [Streptomyces poriferorum]MBW5250234.1 S8 family serine peptidase [Streptomyces poriferorum]MBW5259798.1 S8 family serine peptidase [Streptomyces poriferorum]
MAAGLLLLPLAVPTGTARANDGPAGQTVTRIITLGDAPAARYAAARERAAARAAVDVSQRGVVDAARSAGVDISVRQHYRELVNGLAVEVPASQSGLLATLPGVAAVAEPAVYEAPEAPTPVSTEVLEKAVERSTADARSPDGAPSGREIVTVTELTGVPQAHRKGFTGKGVTVGIIDSGIAYDHPALGGGGFPNAKVLGGYDFADEDADPYDTRNTAAAGHGTHVAGIVAGSDTHIEGVAPDATLRAYRVFGAKNQATDEIVLAALDRAAADGVDVVNMSLGSTGQRSSSVLSKAVDALTESGISAVVAIGNGLAGPFNAAAPAVADQAVAVGSTYSTRQPYLAFTLDDGSATPVPYQPSGRSPVAPASGSAPITEIPAGCDPLPAGSLTGRIALFASPTTAAGVDCRPMDVAHVAATAGAVAAVNHNPQLDPEAIPASPCCNPIDVPVVTIRDVDAQRIQAAPDDTRLTWGAYAGAPLNSDLAGLMDYSSSWGPGNELEFKPDVAAPGGYILSALPPAMNYYGTKSGTSMAAPHTAGVLALMLQADPDLTPAQARAVLQNTATPLAMTGDRTRGLQPVAQQGAGLVDALAAVTSAAGEIPTATPSELALGDTEGRQQSRRITLHNPTGHPVTYRAGQRAAVSAAPPYTSQWQPLDAAAVTRVHNSGRLTIAPHTSKSVTVHIKEPTDVEPGTLFGGWVEFTPIGAGTAQIRVPYLGLAGDFDEVSAFNRTFTDINTTLDNPALRPGYYSFGRSEAMTVDFTDTDTANDQAWVMLSTGHPMFKRLRLQVLDSKGKVVATPYDDAWVARNSGAGTGLDYYSWDATVPDGSPAPAGTYRLRLVFGKALGDPDRAPGTQTWTSPKVTLVR